MKALFDAWRVYPVTRIWATDANNDLTTLPGGRLSILEDLQAVRQQAEHVVKAQLNEMIYDRNRGIDYESTLFNGTPNLLAFESQVRDAVERIPDVISVLEFEADRTGNEISYTMSLQTVFGSGIVTNIRNTGSDFLVQQGVGINGRL